MLNNAKYFGLHYHI